MQVIGRPVLTVTPRASDSSPGVAGDALDDYRALPGELIAQCLAMMRHAMGTGLDVPSNLYDQLDTLLTQDMLRANFAASSAEGSAPAPTPRAATIRELAEIHKALTDLVRPATPAAILLFAHERQRHPFLFAIGPVPLVRHFLLLSAVSLFVLLGVALSPEVSVTNMRKTLLDLTGWSLLVVEIFLLSSASLGSCFANLQKLHGYIAEGSYDPKYQATYWARWVMGIISGILLSQMFFPWLTGGTGVPGESTSSVLVPADLGQPTLAMVGGYSANLVHQLIQKVMGAIESLFGMKR